MAVPRVSVKKKICMCMKYLGAVASIVAIVALTGCESGTDAGKADSAAAEGPAGKESEAQATEARQSVAASPEGVYAPKGLEDATVTIEPLGKALISVVAGYPVRIRKEASEGEFSQVKLPPGDYVLHVGNVEANQGLSLNFHGESGKYYALALTYIVDGEVFWTPVIVEGAPNGPIVADKDGLLVGKSQTEAAALLTESARNAAQEKQAEIQPASANAGDDPDRQRAEKEAEEKVKYLFDKGVKAYQDEQYADALQALDEALMIAPNFDSALVLRGVVLGRLKKPKAAIESLNKGIRIGQNTRGADDEWLHWPFMEKGLILLAVQQPGPAYEALGQSIRARPTPKALLAHANLAFAQGRALGNKGNWDGAEPFFRQAQADAEKGIELEPESTQFWSIKTGTHIMLNEHEQACSAMRKACDLGNCSILEQYPQCKPGGS